MKRINKILTLFLITIISFLLNNLKVEAIGDGTTLKKLYSAFSNSAYEIYEKDEICFFKNSTNNKYVSLAFEYIESSNFYIVYDVTNILDNEAYYNSYILQFIAEDLFPEVKIEISSKKWYQPNETVIHHKYDGNENISSLCGSIKIAIENDLMNKKSLVYIYKTNDEEFSKEAEDNEYFVYNYTKMDNSSKIDGYSEQDVKKLITENKKSQDDKIACDIKLDKDISKTYNVTLRYNSSEGWFLASSSNEKFCFAKTDGQNDFIRIFDFPINFKENFSCDDYKVAPPVGTNRYEGCNMYAIHKDHWSNVSEEITSSVHEAGTKLGVYVLYNNSLAPVISIYKNKSGGIDVEGENNINDKITITNEITNAFLTNNKDKQPNYILETTNGDYIFTNERNTNAKKIYMNYNNLLYVASLGEKEIEKTCQNILGSDFIEFLNNNVFRIIYIAVPILLLALTTFDFAKVVFIDDKEGIQGSFKKFGKRVIAAVLIYLVPTMFIFISDIMGSDELKQCSQAIKVYSEKSK